MSIGGTAYENLQNLRVLARELFYAAPHETAASESAHHQLLSGYVPPASALHAETAKQAAFSFRLRRDRCTVGRRLSRRPGKESKHQTPKPKSPVDGDPVFLSLRLLRGTILCGSNSTRLSHG